MRSAIPLVSVVIGNYNYGKFIGGAIESALGQTYPNVEVIVVDDGSTDESREIIESFGDRISAIFQDNEGQTSALNSGVAASRGAWICLLDSDDLFDANKIQRVCELSTSFPSASMIAHDLEYCDTDGQSIDFASPYILEQRLIDDRRLARRGKMSVSLPATSGLCFRKDIIDRLSPFPDEIRIGIDNYLKWVCLSLVPVLIVPEFLGKQRIHGDNAMTVAVETGGRAGQLHLAEQNAAISFYMKRDHPHLAKLAWKQYGRLLYLLKSNRSSNASAIGSRIRARYSVIDKSAVCLFYVAAAFVAGCWDDLVKSK